MLSMLFREASAPAFKRRLVEYPARPTAANRVKPLKRGVTQNEAPSCWIPDTPIARIATATNVPIALALPNRIVVDPSNAPTKAGNRYSEPRLGLPICCCAASKHPAKPVIADAAMKE